MWPNPLETAGLVTFIEEILNGKLHFLFSVIKVSTLREVLSFADYYIMSYIGRTFENLWAEDFDIRPRVWAWIRIFYKSFADALGIRYPAEAFIKSGP